MTRITFVCRDDVGAELVELLKPHTQLALWGGPEVTLPMQFQRLLIAVLRRAFAGDPDVARELEGGAAMDGIRYDFIARAIRKLPRKQFSGNDKYLLETLVSYMDADGYAFPSLKTLSEDVSADEKTLAARINWLEEIQYIEVKRKSSKAKAKHSRIEWVRVIQPRFVGLHHGVALGWDEHIGYLKSMGLNDTEAAALFSELVANHHARAVLDAFSAWKRTMKDTPEVLKDTQQRVDYIKNACAGYIPKRGGGE